MRDLVGRNVKGTTPAKDELPVDKLSSELQDIYLFFD